MKAGSTLGFRPSFKARRARSVAVVLALFAVGLTAAMYSAGGAKAGAAGRPITRDVMRAALRQELRTIRVSGPGTHALLTRTAGRHPFRRAAALTPSAQRTAKGDGIDLLEPANGSSWVWAAGGYLHFSWYNDWYCTNCLGAVAIVVFDSQGNHAYEGGGACSASIAPSCGTSVDVSLNPGHYTWGVGVSFGQGDTHVSDIWSFDIVSSSAPTPPATTTTVPTPPPPPTTTTTTVPPPATTTSETPPPPPPTTTTAPPTTTAPAPAPTCHVPNVKGMLLADAQLRIFNSNCALGTVTRAKSKVRKGRVIGQSPVSGRTLADDAPVRLLVSRGR